MSTGACSSDISLPDKCQSLRLKSIRKRLEVEQKKNLPKEQQQTKKRDRPAPLSKYRRKTANARERYRMQEVNTAFERLKMTIPHHRLKRIDEKKDTKITTLRCAISYISALSELLNDVNRGKTVSPEYYCTDAELGLEDVEMETKENGKKKRKKKKKGKVKKKKVTKKVVKTKAKVLKPQPSIGILVQQQQPLFISKPNNITFVDKANNLAVVQSKLYLPYPPITIKTLTLDSSKLVQLPPNVMLPQVPLSLQQVNPPPRSVTPNSYSSTPSPQSSLSSPPNQVSTFHEIRSEDWCDISQDISDFVTSDGSGASLQEILVALECDQQQNEFNQMMIVGQNVSTNSIEL